jgi:hypothetical protein
MELSSMSAPGLGLSFSGFKMRGWNVLVVDPGADRRRNSVATKGQKCGFSTSQKTPVLRMKACPRLAAFDVLD